MGLSTLTAWLSARLRSLLLRWRGTARRPAGVSQQLLVTLWSTEGAMQRRARAAKRAELERQVSRLVERQRAGARVGRRGGRGR